LHQTNKTKTKKSGLGGLCLLIDGKINQINLSPMNMDSKPYYVQSLLSNVHKYISNLFYHHKVFKYHKTLLKASKITEKVNEEETKVTNLIINMATTLIPILHVPIDLLDIQKLYFFWNQPSNIYNVTLLVII
jgi:uncharacterized membrane protein